ncbi:hypothetical protein Mapa_008804 [Marchantia paleacea]|nr:hypothetical protein Mapa_008804 [Marchantia paleacea]
MAKVAFEVQSTASSSRLPLIVSLAIHTRVKSCQKADRSSRTPDRAFTMHALSRQLRRTSLSRKEELSVLNVLDHKEFELLDTLCGTRMRTSRAKIRGREITGANLPAVQQLLQQSLVHLQQPVGLVRREGLGVAHSHLRIDVQLQHRNHRFSHSAP